MPAVFGKGDWELVRYDGSVWSSRKVRIGADGVVQTHDGGPLLTFAGEACTVVRSGLMVLCADDLVMRTEADFHDMRKRVALRQLFSSTGDIMELVRNGVTWAWAILAIVLLWLVASMRGDVGTILAYLKVVAQQFSH